MENGYYWIKFRNEWQIAEYCDGYFAIHGQDEEVRTNRVQEIGDHVEVPEKYK